MDLDQRIEALQQQIDKLSSEMTRYQFRLRELCDELARLKQEQGASPGAKPAVSKRQVPNPAAIPQGLENFIGLRLIHIVGIVLLVIGLSIGVKYAIDRELISEWGRILLAYLAGVVLFILSIRLRQHYAAFSAILFSGAMSTFYFTSYAAFTYYQFYNFPLTFVLMVLLTVFTAYMALRYNRQEIGILGMIGAYGIPFLISNNSDRLDLFFSYILVINIGVAFLSFRKKWEAMKSLAMIITWVLFIGASFARFAPVTVGIMALFLGLFYILFMGITIGDPLRWQRQFDRHDIYRVMVNQSALYLGMWGVLEGSGIDLTAVTGFFFLFLAACAWASWYFLRAEIMLNKYQVLLALLCWLVYIPMQWDSVYVDLMWLLTSLILFVAGVYLRMTWPRIAAIILIGLTILKLVFLDSLYFSTIEKIIAFLSVGTLLLGVAFFYQKLRRRLFDNAKEESESKPESR